jgi:hypothetical protein
MIDPELSGYRGEFEITSFTEGQSWSASGLADLNKMRGHKSGLGELVIQCGANGYISTQNGGNVGIVTKATMPIVAAVDAGGIPHVSGIGSITILTAHFGARARMEPLSTKAPF